jgi:hypothetical protein
LNSPGDAVKDMGDLLGWNADAPEAPPPIDFIAFAPFLRYHESLSWYFFSLFDQVE